MIKKVENRDYTKYNLKEMNCFFSTLLSREFIVNLTHYRINHHLKHIIRLQDVLINFLDERNAFETKPSVENFLKMQNYLRNVVRSDEFQLMMIDIIKELQEKDFPPDEWRTFVKEITAMYFLINIGNIEDYDYKTAVFLDNDTFKEEIKLPYLKDHLNAKIYRSLVSTFNNRANDMKYDTVFLDLNIYNYICLQILKNLQCHIELVIDIEYFSKDIVKMINSIPYEIYSGFMQIHNKIVDIIDAFYQDESARTICTRYVKDIPLDETVQFGLEILKMKDQLPKTVFDLLIEKIDFILQYWFIFNDYSNLYDKSLDTSFDEDDDYDDDDEDFWDEDDDEDFWDEDDDDEDDDDEDDDYDDDEDEDDDYDDDDDEDDDDEDDDYDDDEDETELDYLDEVRLDYNPWKYKSESDYKLNTGKVEMTYCDIFDVKTIRINYLDYMKSYAKKCPQVIELIPEKFRDKDLKKEYEEELAEIEEWEKSTKEKDK